MSYDSIDQSVQDADPVLLFQFVRGATTWRYCALPVDFAARGQTWLSEVIGLAGNIKNGSDISKNDLGVTLPSTNAMAAAFLAYAPDAVTTLTIFRTLYSNPTLGGAVWKGRVLHTPTAIATVTLNCESIFSSMRRMGLRQVYTRKCRHMLFKAGCNLNAADYALTVTVSNVVANVVTLSTSGLAQYLGGNIKAPDGTLRKIIEQAGSVLTLMRPVQSLIQQFAAHPGGFTATLYPGCDKSTATCRATFGNIGNHGGFAGMNGINPMDWSTNAF